MTVMLRRLLIGSAWMVGLGGLVGLLLVAQRAPTRAQSPDPAAPWQQVNASAFGLPANGGYINEEGFEVLVFNEQVYVGMEADNSLGARLWRSRAGETSPATQADWEEVAADADGAPFGNPRTAQNDHIDSLAAFQGQLYVSTANRDQVLSGTLLYRSPSGNPLSWTQVISPGFGDGFNTNIKDLQVFEGQLCGGTQNTRTGTQVWCTPDGSAWSQVNISGFGDPANQGTWSAYVFADALYLGVQHVRDNSVQGRLFRSTTLDDPSAWVEVYAGPVGSVQVDILGSLDQQLYIATQSINGIAILRSSTSDDSLAWERINTVGMDGTRANSSTPVDGAAIYNAALYVAVSNEASGLQVWRTSGQGRNGLVDWEQVASGGLGDQNNIYAQLVPFGDYLYAWTTNYVSGQQVRRARFARPTRPLYLPALQR